MDDQKKNKKKIVIKANTDLSPKLLLKKEFIIKKNHSSETGLKLEHKKTLILTEEVKVKKKNTSE